MDSMILYVESSGSQKSCLTVTSRICLFLLNALENDKIAEISKTQIVCIVSDNTGESTSLFKSTKEFSRIQMEDEGCPKVIRAVKLPVLMSHNGQMVHCGLASVLRKLVKHSHLCQPAKNLNTLLVIFMAAIHKKSQISGFVLQSEFLCHKSKIDLHH